MPFFAMKLRKTEFTLLGMGAFVLLLHLAKVLSALPTLPEQIPLKFDFNGDPSNYSPAYFIWLLPILGCMLQILFLVVGSRPHTHNLPWTVTSENKELLYRHSMQFVFTLNIMIQITFLITSGNIIQSALQNANRAFIYFLPVLMISLGTVIGFFYLKGRRLAETITLSRSLDRDKHPGSS